MSRRQVGLFRQGLILFDTMVTLVAFVVAFYFRQWIAMQGGALVTALELPTVTVAEDYEVLLALCGPLWALSLYVSGTTDFRVNYGQTFIRYARAVALGVALLVAVSFLMKLLLVARSFLLVFGIFDLVFLMCGRFALLETIGYVRSKRVDGHRMLVVGTAHNAVSYAQSLATQPPWNIRTVGHVTVPGEVGHELATPVLGTIDMLDQILDAQPVDEVLFAAPVIPPNLLAVALSYCDERGVDVLLPLPSALPARGSVEIAQLDGFDAPLLGLRRTPSSEVGLALKRVVDIMGSLFLITMSAPAMIAVALAIKFSSPGPIVFKQIRAGRNGRKFTMLKFRSMVVDAEARKAALAHLNEMDGPVFKIRRDPRITPIGAFIRKTSLDELPQFFNILFGDMSLVGPRPPLPSEVEKYKPWQRRRLSVKPGLTGLWQVSGRNNVDFEEWMKLDLRYIDDWSLWLDVKILLRTVPAVVFKTGAS